MIFLNLEQAVQVLTEHLVAGMELEQDIQLKAGSYLITRRELGGARLDEKVIESIRKFSGQIVPEPHQISIRNDRQTLVHLKDLLRRDLDRVVEEVCSGRVYEGFLCEEQLQLNIMRVMEILFTNPGIVELMYESRFSSRGGSQLDCILDHSLRTALLAVALGIKLHWTIFSLVSLGMAALLHDLGILSTPPYPHLDSVDDLTPAQLEEFIQRHQVESALLFNRWQQNMTPYQKGEIFHILANHHAPDVSDRANRNTVLFYFADLFDEMVSHLPHRRRYNFNARQLEALDPRYRERVRPKVLLAGLKRLYGRQRDSLAWEIILRLSELMSLRVMLEDDLDLRLGRVLAECPFQCANFNPLPGEDSLPQTVWCGNGRREDFACPHLSSGLIDISEAGQMVSYRKCRTLTERLGELSRRSEE